MISPTALLPATIIDAAAAAAAPVSHYAPPQNQCRSTQKY